MRENGIAANETKMKEGNAKTTKSRRDKYRGESIGTLPSYVGMGSER